MSVKINKPGGDDEARRVHDFRRIAGVEPADFGNLAILDSHVGLVAGHPRPIDDRAIFNNGIELRHNSLLYGISRLCASRSRVNEYLLTNSKWLFTCQGSARTLGADGFIPSFDTPCPAGGGAYAPRQVRLWRADARAHFSRGGPALRRARLRQHLDADDRGAERDYGRRDLPPFFQQGGVAP